eukprot:360342-Chlamydomonas_euryale.AAC.8
MLGTVATCRAGPFYVGHGGDMQGRAVLCWAQWRHAGQGRFMQGTAATCRAGPFYAGHSGDMQGRAVLCWARWRHAGHGGDVQGRAVLCRARRRHAGTTVAHGYFPRRDWTAPKIEGAET